MCRELNYLLPTELLIPICENVNTHNGFLKHVKLQYKLNKEIMNFFIQERIFENYTIGYSINSGDILQEIIFEYMEDYYF